MGGRGGAFRRLARRQKALMTGDEEAVRTLTLLVAVCERAVAALEAVDPPADRRLVEAAQRLGRLAGVAIRSGSFAATDG
jgi:hypothetical protein